MDARSESGADFFYMLINAPTLNCVVFFNLAFPVYTTTKKTMKEYKQLTISLETMIAFELLVC